MTQAYLKDEYAPEAVADKVGISAPRIRAFAQHSPKPPLRKRLSSNSLGQIGKAHAMSV